MMAPPKVSLAVRNRVKFALALHIVENRGEQPIQDYISDLGLHLISLSDAKETVASMQEQLREMRAKLASLEREKESGAREWIGPSKRKASDLTNSDDPPSSSSSSRSSKRARASSSPWATGLSEISVLSSNWFGVPSEEIFEMETLLKRARDYTPSYSIHANLEIITSLASISPPSLTPAHRRKILSVVLDLFTSISQLLELLLLLPTGIDSSGSEDVTRSIGNLLDALVEKVVSSLSEEQDDVEEIRTKLGELVFLPLIEGFERIEERALLPTSPTAAAAGLPSSSDDIPSPDPCRSTTKGPSLLPLLLLLSNLLTLPFLSLPLTLSLLRRLSSFLALPTTLPPPDSPSNPSPSPPSPITTLLLLRRRTIPQLAHLLTEHAISLLPIGAHPCWEEVGRLVGGMHARREMVRTVLGEEVLESVKGVWEGVWMKEGEGREVEVGSDEIWEEEEEEEEEGVGGGLS